MAAKIFLSTSPQRGDSEETLLGRQLQALGGTPKWGASVLELQSAIRERGGAIAENSGGFDTEQFVVADNQVAIKDAAVLDSVIIRGGLFRPIQAGSPNFNFQGPGHIFESNVSFTSLLVDAALPANVSGYRAVIKNTSAAAITNTLPFSYFSRALGLIAANTLVIPANSILEVIFSSDANAVFSGVEFGVNNPTLLALVNGLPVFGSNASAITGGLTVGMLYRSGGNPDAVYVVH